MRFPGRTGVRGFTLVEVVIAVALLGILAAYAFPKLQTPATMTLRSQAHGAADVIRRAQSLAMTRKQRMAVTATTGANGRIDAACATPSCTTDTSYQLAQNVVLGGGGALYFNSLGQPVDAAGVPLGSSVSYTLTFGSGYSAASATVTVAALSGRVIVTP